MVKVLVVGGGGREHALCWSLAASPLIDRLWCAPGNAGIAAEAECVPIAASDIDGLLAFAGEQRPDLVVVGPEQPLVAGLVDRLQAAGIKAFGPSAAAARLEGSKQYMKGLCRRQSVPTADYAIFTADQAAAAHAHIDAVGAPIVVKADGLAAGKGVVVAETAQAAHDAVDAALVDRKFGEAGGTVVIEECMSGPEISVFALADGRSVLPFASAQDYKRAGDGDSGPNTGGMGAVSPSPLMTSALMDQVMSDIVRPVVDGMAAEGCPFHGVLYAGLMLTETGPRVLEFNARFGDPECQAMLVRLRSDLLPVLLAAADGALDTVDLRWRDERSVCVVMASEGYPGPVTPGSLIGGLAEADVSATIFHAGTKGGPSGGVLADGGRVLGITAAGASYADARAAAYAGVDRLDWPQGFCRRDIAAGL